MPTPINGTSGNDTLLGTTGNDSIVGLGGDDRIYSSAGTDTIDGDTGSDTVDYSNEIAPVSASLTTGLATRSSGTDTLLNIEHLHGGKGSDTLAGNASDNLLIGYDGDDDFRAKGGNDTIFGDFGNDTLRGEAGNDSLYGGIGNDYIEGDSGFDRLEGGAGNDSLDGGADADTLIGGDGDDLYYIRDNLDSIFESNPDSVYGGGGVDTVYLFNITNYTLGDNLENAWIQTGSTNLTGNSINNVLFSGPGNDTLDGQGGTDWVSYALKSTGVVVSLAVTGPQATGYGSDTLLNIENLSGTIGNDQLTGDSNNNSLEGLDGNDTLSGGDGNDILIENGGSGFNDSIDGGAGDDTLVYDIATGTTGVSVDLRITTAQNTGAGNDTIIGIEHLYGGKGNDKLTGSTANNKLSGSDGNDTLEGIDGNDTLTGGEGADRFLFSSTPNSTNNLDTVTDFTPLSDKIVLRDTVFNAFTTAGPVAAGKLLAGPGIVAAVDADDYLLFNTSTGALYYDADGSLTTFSPVQIAILQGVTVLVAGDIEVAVENKNLTGTSYSDTLSGGNGNDTLDGGTGYDFLNGGRGNDLLLGGGGNDNLDGGPGIDTMDGGSDNDHYYVDDPADVIVESDSDPATGGYDTVHITSTSYTLPANVESAELGTGTVGVIGNDISNFIFANSGNNNINGMDGSDTVSYANASAAVTIDLGASAPQITGGSGTDTLINIESLIGTNYNDALTGNSADNWLDGRSGTDTLTGGDGNDSYVVDNENDVVVETNANITSGGRDTVYSYANAYTLGANIEDGYIWNIGNSNITGNALDNRLYAGEGSNVIDGGDGNDWVYYFHQDYGSYGVEVDLNITGQQYTGESGYDTLISIENIGGGYYDDELTGNNIANELEGNDGDDTLTGNGGNDTLRGGAHNDFLDGGEGNDFIDGGEGNDTVSYLLAPAAVSVTLSSGASQTSGGGGNDTLLNIENIGGSVFNDQLTGDSGPNMLAGSAGNDTLTGGGGNDILVGGADNDRFLFNATPNATTNLDIVADFIIGQDKLWLDKTIFTAFSATGPVSADNFRKGATALDSNDFILFDNTDNSLYYDADGTGPIAPVKFATLSTIGNAEGVTREFSEADFEIVNATLFNGTSGNDTLIGSESNDILNGLGGNDWLDGGPGNDTMTGGDGSDNYTVRDGGDVVIETNTDSSTGGFDQVFSHLATYTLPANVESGFIQLESAADITGNGLSNFLGAGKGNNVIDGGAGFDTVSFYGSVTGSSGVTVSLAVSGAQTTGGSGTDTLMNIEGLIGTAYDDTLTGNSSSNSLDGSSGNDSLSGGDGDDFLSEHTGNDIIDGGNGFDTLRYYSELGVTVDLSNPRPQNTIGAGTDTITNIEHLVGTNANDTLIGNSFDNYLSGGDGNDLLNGGAGNDSLGGNNDDTLDGGNGNDTATYASSWAGVTVSLAITTLQNTIGAGIDLLRDIENLAGSPYADKITGNSNNNLLSGNNGADTLNGGLGNDTLEGGSGADTFVFNTLPDIEINVDRITDFTAGTDKILLDNTVFVSLPSGPLNAGNLQLGTNALDPNDFIVLSRSENEFTLYYDADGSGPISQIKIATLISNTAITAADIEITAGTPINGTSGNDTLIGTAGNDLINGLQGMDFIDGGAGIDTMIGGDGSDSYVVRDVGDTVTETNNDSISGGQDYVNSYLASYTLPANVEGGGIMLTSAANLTGNSLNNFLAAGQGDNIIDGGDGIDTVDYHNNAVTGSTGVTIDLTSVAQNTGGSGLDTLLNIEGVRGTDYADSLTGNAGNNHLDGHDGNDTLLGGDGDDMLSETTGDDSINGGAGTDTLSYYETSVALTINLNITAAQNTGAGNDTIIGIENLIGGQGHDNLLGNSQNNMLQGMAGNDTLDGADGNDFLDGGTGADYMVGGDGNDVYVIDSDSDVVIETNGVNSGIDTVNSYLPNYTLLSNFENGFILSAGTANLNGNSLNNFIGAGTGNNIIDGGAGIDTVSYQNAVTGSAGVSVSLAISGPIATGGSGSDTLLNIENITGSPYDDTLVGDGGSNRLEGLTGNDTLFGGDGDDFLVDFSGNNFVDGGNGADELNFSSLTTSTGITVNLNTTTSQATGVGSSIILNIEHLYGGKGNDTFTGNADNNKLRGNEGNDTLIGGAGNDQLDGGNGIDSMIGGDGNDNYFVDNAEDVVLETNADSKVGGIDTVNSFRTSYQLGNNIENGIILATSAADMAGNNLDNFITAGVGNNLINGGDGLDTVSYDSGTSATAGVTVSLAVTGAQSTVGSGSDTLVSIENLRGSQYDDVLTGNANANRIEGHTGNDSLVGGDGNDSLGGGLGNDTLTGGAGVDRFMFGSTLNASSNADLLTDFTSATDKIVLSTEIFAAFSASGTFTVANLRSGAGVTVAEDADDFLIYNTTTNQLYYDADGSGTTFAPVYFARLQSGAALLPSDIELFTAAGITVGSTGGDILTGTSGSDLLDGGDGDDSINGGDGNDILIGGTGNDAVNGGPGIDTASYTTATSNAVAELHRGKALDGQGGKDTLTSIENLVGGPQNDILIGNEIANFLRGEDGDDIVYGNGGDDSLLGGNGNDLLRGGPGDNFIDGGTGVDTVDYSDRNESVDVYLGDGYSDLSGGDTDILVNIENVIGTALDDYLEGNSLANRLEGGKGNDDLDGGGGDDILVGGVGDDLLFGDLGNDVLAGGRGADGFVFNTAPGPTNIDQVIDFDPATDKLVFDLAIFTAGLGTGTVSATKFRAGPAVATAADIDDYLLYDTTSGVLYYDADGQGTTHAPLAVVTLIGAPTLVAGVGGNLSTYTTVT